MPEQLDDKSIAGLKRLLSLLDPDTLTKEEFVKQFKNVIDFVKKIEEKNIRAIKAMEETHKKLTKKLDDFNNQNTSNFSNKFKLELEALKKQHSDLMNKIEIRIAEIKDGQDGKDADEEAIYSRLIKELPAKDDIANSIPIIGERVRDSLELLDGDDRLMMSAIKGLEEKIQELEGRPLGGKSGGGFSYIHMSRQFVDDETPSGTVNGSNADFTIAKTPNPTSSLKVYVNGQRMRVTEDYTLSARTITFITPPPTGSILLCDYRF